MEKCLWSVKKSVKDVGYSNFEVVIIDDGTPLDDAELIKEVVFKVLGVTCIRFEKQLGNVARYNTIIENSKGNIVFLVDNDVILPDRWFWSALYFLENNKCGVASYLSQKVNDQQVAELMSKPKIPAVGSGRTPERATELAGYCFGFLRENWELVGGFDERNFKYFIGDSDFCCKLAEQGLMSYRILYPMVYHREHATYDAHPELQAWQRVNEDLANFQKKWGATPKEMEAKFLSAIKPQRIRWYANYSHYEEWDDESMRVGFGKFVGVMPFEEVPKEIKGKEEVSV